MDMNPWERRQKILETLCLRQHDTYGNLAHLIHRVVLYEVDQAYLLFQHQHGFLAPVILQNFIQGKAD